MTHATRACALTVRSSGLLLVLAAYSLLACADDGELVAQPEVLELPATEATVPVEFTADLTGQGTQLVGAIRVSANVGTVSVDGRSVAVFAQDYLFWSFANVDAFQLVGVTPDRLYSFFLYCDAAGQLTHVFFETTDGKGMLDEPASGSCALLQNASRSAVSFPAVSMPPPPVVHGFTAHGNQLALEDGAPGWLYLEGRKLTLYPFASVDCSASCGQSPGWWELHSILWDPVLGQATLGVLYLNLMTPGSIRLEYALSLPLLERTARGTSYESRWTSPPGASTDGLRGARLRRRY